LGELRKAVALLLGGKKQRLHKGDAAKTANQITHSCQIEKKKKELGVSIRRWG